MSACYRRFAAQQLLLIQFATGKVDILVYVETPSNTNTYMYALGIQIKQCVHYNLLLEGGQTEEKLNVHLSQVVPQQ